MDFNGTQFQYKGVSINTKTVQKKIPIYLAGKVGPKAFELAGEVGDGAILSDVYTQDWARKIVKILRNSFAVWIALDEDRCIGFINAISDKVFYAYIPLLEVLPKYQGKGIGMELTRRMLMTLKDMYAIDICCDEQIVPFYKKIGFSKCNGMVKRNRYLH